MLQVEQGKRVGRYRIVGIPEEEQMLAASKEINIVIFVVSPGIFF